VQQESTFYELGVGFLVLTVETMKCNNFRDVMPCCLEELTDVSEEYTASIFRVEACLIYSWILKMEAVCSSRSMWISKRLYSATSQNIVFLHSVLKSLHIFLAHKCIISLCASIPIFYLQTTH
jgi:hypothetical protein